MVVTKCPLGGGNACPVTTTTWTFHPNILTYHLISIKYKQILILEYFFQLKLLITLQSLALNQFYDLIIFFILYESYFLQ